MNKKIKSILMFATLITMMFGVFGNATPASAMTCNSATIESTVSTYDHPVSAYFNYGTDAGQVENKQGLNTPTQVIQPNTYLSQFVNGLSENTTYYYKLVVQGQSATTSVNQFTTPSCNNTQPTSQNPTVSLVANPSTVSYNGSSILTWTSTNANSCSGSGGTNGWSGNVNNTSGSFSSGGLTNTTTFNITCTNSSGASAYASATVTVQSNNTCQDSTATNYGGTLPCNYYTNNTCRDINATNYGYSLPCIYNNNNYQIPTVSLYANPTSVSYNGSSILTWYSTNASYCSLTGGILGWNNQSTSGSQSTGPLTNTTTYNITCTSSRGQQASSSATVYVNNQVYIPPAINNSLTVVTNPATGITNTSAQLNSLIGNSASGSVNAWFNWGPTINMGNTTNSTNVDSLPTVIHTDTLTGLNPGTTYYFQAVAQSPTSTAIGSILSFTTGGTRTTTITYTPRTGSAVVLVTSSVNRDQPIVPTLDNTRPHPGDQINYTIDYQNVGNASVTNLTLQTTLPDQVEYISSTPTNPTISGNTLIFNLGTLRAGASGQVTIKTQVLESATAGTLLNFPATLSYIDPSGQLQTASANVSATVYSPTTGTVSNLGAFVFGSGFLPTNVFGWLLLLILILILVLLAKYLYGRPFSRQTVTTTSVPQKTLGTKKTTTTTVVHE